MAKYTESQLAQMARNLVSEFNFQTRTPKKQSQLQDAKNLYRRIFFDNNFKREKSRNFSFAFDDNIFAKCTTCKKCAKRVYESLKKFAAWVLD